MDHDPVNHPKHYTSHPSGVECITITEHMNFNVGNAVKYLWRLGEKGDELEQLKKARWYVDREITRLQLAVLETQATAEIEELERLKAIAERMAAKQKTRKVKRK